MGRRRKASTSTVATVDKVRFPWTKESSILKPVPADLFHGSWPIFVLHDAVIYQKDGQTLGNPLFLDQQGPMVVRGKLDFTTDSDDEEPDNLASLLKPNIKTANVEIPASLRYSIGYGDIALWVSGTAGWYEVRPAPEYEEIYLQIYEAIMLYYEALNIIDEYRKRKKRKPKKAGPEPTPDDVFLRYAIGAGDGVTRDEAEARYRKWAPFLVSHFPKESELAWEVTLFAKWVHQIYSEMGSETTDATPAAAASRPSSSSRLAASVGEDDSQSTRSSERSRSKSARLQRRGSQDVEMTDMPSPQTHQLAIRKGKSHVETPVPLPPQYLLAQARTPDPSPSTLPKAVASTPVDVLLDVLDDISAARGRDLSKTKAGTVHTQLYMMCRIKPYKAASEVTAFYAKDLLARLPQEWRGTDFYDYLLQASKKPLVLEHTTAVQIPSLCERRNKAPPRAPRGPRGGPSLPQSHTEDDSDDDATPGRRARKSGKAAVLRLVSSSKKRPASALSFDDESSTGRASGRKLAKTSHTNTDDEDTGEASDSDDMLDIAEDNDDKTAFILSPPPESVQVVVIAEQIPTMSPTGPNGTWVCEQEGCNHIVRAANEVAGQALVQAHFRHHEAQAERVTLAKQESRGLLPINHLLDKIQALAGAVFGSSG
ncbi:hypothetical protein B0T16DRAFT_404879 [Cercophora newfieldiana]|uniref:DNA (cytosine-5)-methyltransferase 1 replication foci domain-containing protein n=1 Tax=Cercophora newfieldiana TaxID=92897 RepID=A0AA39YG13_9PEZI|nr:hypothetical protein B0T16DRAFT_404879 [Cercophora newfieldiana]